MDSIISTDKPIILIIDDNTTNLKVAIDYLEAHGFEVVVARSGESGINRARFSRPDLILLDVQMPGLDGFETCRHLKADPATSAIPIIFMTVLNETADKVKAFAAGAVDYVTKPLQLDEVLARVRTHLSIRSLQLQLQQHNQLLEQRVAERTAALAAANESLQAEIAQRRLHQQEKDKLFDVVRDQSEQLRALTNWLIQTQQTKQQTISATLHQQVDQKLQLVESTLQLLGQLLHAPSQSTPHAELISSYLTQALQLLTDIRADMSAVEADLRQPLPEVENPLVQLSGREREIVELIGAGKSPAEIASLLYISLSTVYTHRNHILEKLNLDSPAELVTFALQHRNFYDRNS